MVELRRNINRNSKDISRRYPWYDPENNILLSGDDKDLFGKISDFMKGKFDIEDVKDDPSYNVMDRIVTDMISDHDNKIQRNKENEKFIRENLSFDRSEEKIEEEIRDIEEEINKSDVADITAEWIKTWHDKKQENVKNTEKEKIRDFIISSLEPGKKIKYESAIARERSPGRVLYIRYLTLAAAVITGAIFIVKSLLPSNDPERLFNTYYSPLSAVPAVTRSFIPEVSGNYSYAVESYRNGRYEEASLGFSDILVKDTSLVSARFFLGITDIPLGKYDEASQLLEEVAGRQGEFAKEARWYLGLALLKTGDKNGASECFRMLAQTPGFYSERAGKILRRLK